MAIAFDAASSTTGFQQATLTVSHTCTGSELVLIAITAQSAGTPGTISGITYNSVAMTSLWSVASANDRCTGWYLVAPATGAHNLVATYAGGGGANDEQGLAGVSYTGVDQTTPIGTPASASGTGTTATVNVSSASGELVVDGLYAFFSPISVGANQTERLNTNGATGGFASMGSSHEAGAATVTMSWTTPNDQWAIGAVPLKPSGGGGGGGDHPASKRFGGVPGMAFPGRGNVWAPYRRLIWPGHRILKPA